MYGDKMTDDREQFVASLRVNCAGAPTVKVKNEEGMVRRKLCQTYKIIEIKTWKMQSLSDDVLRQHLSPDGWMKTKTLNKWVWLCPSCHTFVIRKREEAKRLWG
jgi:hypothetical protein